MSDLGNSLWEVQQGTQNVGRILTTYLLYLISCMAWLVSNSLEIWSSRILELCAILHPQVSIMLSQLFLKIGAGDRVLVMTRFFFQKQPSRSVLNDNYGKSRKKVFASLYSLSYFATKMDSSMDIFFRNRMLR